MSSSFEGTLESGQLLDILRSIGGRRASGLLSVQGEPDLVSVTFVDGAVVAADAMNRPAEDVLAGVLASRGLLGPADFAEAVEPFFGTGRLASEVLLELRKVPPEELLDAVREQTYGQLVRLMRWENGNFNWTEGAESPYQEGMEPISVAEAVVRSTEELGVEGPLPSGLPDLDAPHRPTGADGYLVVGRDGDWIVAGDVPWLTPDEERLLELLREGESASGLIAATGWDRYRVEFGVYQLEALGLLTGGGWEAGEDDVEVGEDTATLVLGSSEVPMGGADPSSTARSAELATVPLRSEETGGAGDLPTGELETLARTSEGPATALPEAEITPTPGTGAGVDDPLGGGADPFSAALATPTRHRRTALAQVTALWTARALALGLVSLLTTLLLVQEERPSLLMPYPWQGEARSLLERHQTLSRYQKIDRAVRTYYLLYGRPPESLATLADLELLSSSDLYDPAGRWLSYTGRETGYVVQPVEGGEVVPGSELAADARADFFLNPKFVDLPVQRPDPVVLID